jgi:[ribosomal protein S5]-alanine N-acetyltransferase
LKRVETDIIMSELPIETPRMMLEPLVPRHAPTVYEELLNPELYQYIPQNPPQALQEVETRYGLLAARKSPDGQDIWLNWAARLRQEQTYIGTFQATVHTNQMAEIAYSVFVRFWKQGYGREGCYHVLEHLFSRYDVMTVGAEIDTRNIASINLVESLGFTRVSLTKNADYFKGASSDEYRYEISRDQFQFKKPE